MSRSRVTTTEQAEAAAVVWGVRYGRPLAERGCSPTLVWLTAQVSGTLPTGPVSDALTGFVQRHQWTLMAMVDEAFQSAPPPGMRLDVTPPRVGVLHRSMSLSEAEDAMRGEAEEHVVIVHGPTGAQIARFGPAMTRAHGADPAGCTVVDRRLYAFGPRSGEWILSHNHPRCGPLSNPDLTMAASMNLAEMRAVCPDGWTWWIQRPARGWPEYFTVSAMAEEAYEAAYLAASERDCDGDPFITRQEPSDDWTKHFTKTYVNFFNRQGRGLGLRMQGAHRDGRTTR